MTPPLDLLKDELPFLAIYITATMYVTKSSTIKTHRMIQKGSKTRFIHRVLLSEPNGVSPVLNGTVAGFMVELRKRQVIGGYGIDR
jgi:hypothetical protein